MKFLEHELAEQERELERKAADGKEEPAPVTVVPEHIERLEMRVRELEAMVKGLTEELLDVKSVTRKLSVQIEKFGGAPVRSHPEAAAARSGVRRPEVTAEPAAADPVQIRSRPQPSQMRQEPSAGIRRPVPQAPAAAVPAPAPRRPISAPVPEPARRPAVLSEAEEEAAVAKLKAGEFEYVMQPDGTIQKRRKTQAHNVIIAGTGYSPRQTSRSSAIRADSNAVIEAEEDDTEELKR